MPVRALWLTVLLVSGAALAADTPSGKLYPSRRCGECHGRQRDEWSRSTHALAASGAYLKALQGLEPARRQGCEGCHVPLAAGGARPSADGVGCDACHTATAAASPPLALTLSPELATRFGPYSDSKDHHFHRTGFSAFVTSDALCVACHEGGEATAGGVRPYTTVSEWQQVKGRKACKACHMPTFKAIAAKGEKERKVAHHDFGADSGDRLQAAVTLRLAAQKGAVLVELSNTGAQHALPTGRPEQALKVELTFLDKGGAPLETVTRRLARALVDAQGRPADGFTAAREEQDTRLVPGRPFSERLPAPPNTARARARLWYEPFATGEPTLVKETEAALSGR